MKKSISLTLTLFASALFLAAPWQESAASTTQGKGKSNVSALYQQHCSKCHGADGKGIESLRGSDIPNFEDAKWQAAHSDKAFTDALNNGKGIMPGYKDVLSASEVRALVKHVRSFAPSAKSKKK